MKPLRFRGVPLEPNETGSGYGGWIRGVYVQIWPTPQHEWRAAAHPKSFIAAIAGDPCDSPESALRSLLGVIGNAHRELGKVLEPVRKAKR